MRTIQMDLSTLNIGCTLPGNEDRNRIVNIGGRPELSMGWVDPWVGLGWGGSNFLDFCELDRVVLMFILR